MVREWMKRGYSRRESTKKMGTVFLGVLKPEEGTLRVFAAAAAEPVGKAAPSGCCAVEGPVPAPAGRRR